MWPNVISIKAWIFISEFFTHSIEVFAFWHVRKWMQIKFLLDHVSHKISRREKKELPNVNDYNNLNNFLRLCTRDKIGWFLLHLISFEFITTLQNLSIKILVKSEKRCLITPFEKKEKKNKTNWRPIKCAFHTFNVYLFVFFNLVCVFSLFSLLTPKTVFHYIAKIFSKKLANDCRCCCCSDKFSSFICKIVATIQCTSST